MTGDKISQSIRHAFHAGQVVQPRLLDVRPSKWAKIRGDDMLLRDLPAGFFRCEYQFTAVFHKDLFFS